MTRLLLVFFISLSMVSLTFGQTKTERISMTKDAIRTLQEGGGLVVRLNTNTRKITAIKEQLANPDLDATQRKRFERFLADTQSETQHSNQVLIEAMQAQYKIGPLYFLPDTAFSLLNGQTSKGAFLNAAQEIDPSITPPQDDYLIMRVGYSDPSNTSRAEGFILMDSEMETIPAPFPGIVTFNNAGFALNSLLAPEMAERRRVETAVARLVKKLTRTIDTYGN